MPCKWYKLVLIQLNIYLKNARKVRQSEKSNLYIIFTSFVSFSHERRRQGSFISFSKEKYDQLQVTQCKPRAKAMMSPLSADSARKSEEKQQQYCTVTKATDPFSCIQTETLMNFNHLIIHFLESDFITHLKLKTSYINQLFLHKINSG